MSSINDFFENIIGFSFNDNPVLYAIYCLFVFWFLYQLFGLIYRGFGIK